MKSINNHLKSKNSKRIPSPVGPQPYRRHRRYGCGSTELEMFQEKMSETNKNKNKKKISSKFFLEIFQMWRARSHTFGAKAMAGDLLN
jgi:hypothetical protein